ncbi:hypothetical protein Xen7305DRAFT_00027550 [Xenococcus sp. PCC 7305]|uniref:DUF5615 family PIN-like protein n=1 Tax=Xenococcus sp. PCC 7305 TaxID=102125 RepID=UPI0002ACFDFF|nr:DUF5615 family PIN-like protein [Xenococcus sp. PCC 7305]ELS03037.1 hypothetical protein Xen7305DRAFT_00027550 [Xenococcus sp. PCC 7305]
MKVRFLLDENLSPRLKLAILRLNPHLDVLRVGESEAPALGTLDPDILIYLQSSQRILLTDNRKSMPQHLEAHWACGGFIWGLFWLRPKASLRELAENIILIWETTEAEEWKDQLIWIPLQ